MRRVVLAILGLTLLPSLAAAQVGVDNCFSCFLGIFDDVNLSASSGTINAFEQKEIYVGAVLSPSIEGVTSLELSIAGLPSSSDALVDVQGVVPFDVNIGDINAPPDTSIAGDEANPYGKNCGWSTCQSGTALALIRISIFPFVAVPANSVYEVKRRYPSTYPGVRSPLVVGCDFPTNTAWRVTAGCYVANPSGGDLPRCTTAVEPTSWTGVKQLFR